MSILPRQVELSFDMTIERPHHAYPGKHRRSAALGNQQQRFHRGLPFRGIVFGLWQLGDVERGVAEGDERLAFGQFDRIEELLVPRHDFSLAQCLRFRATVAPARNLINTRPQRYGAGNGK
jgi:hypothetical protein